MIRALQYDGSTQSLDLIISNFYIESENVTINYKNKRVSFGGNSLKASPGDWLVSVPQPTNTFAFQILSDEIVQSILSIKG